jgi:Ca2+-binding RTX toxin-like protein
MPTTTTIQLDTARIATGLQNPLYAVAPPGDRNRLFIVEQTGGIKILDLRTQAILPTPFLTIPAGELQTVGEQGLLGLVFHPDYATNGKFYVSYSSPGGGNAGQNKLVEYQVSGDPNVANPGSARVILTRNQPVGNHNGGWVGFGPDGYLYWSTGDGGGSLSENAQDITDNPLGKMLRLDVNGDDFPTDPNRNYAIPATNPFINQPGDDEIWAYGLRNPWRSSFDRQTGDLYIADVGQGTWEEVNIQSAGSAGGQNYGWDAFEGTTPYITQPTPPNLVNPAYQYAHNGASRSITGGYVYRGPVAALNGSYFFADFAVPQLWSLRYDGSGVTDVTNQSAALTPSNGQGTVEWISSFGEDADGNLYITDIFGGEIFRLEVKQTITGTDADDVGIGGPSNDILSGLGGNDDLFGREGADSIQGDAGIDYLFGEAGADTLNGGTEGDYLEGGTEADSLNGNEGSDTLLGGLGNDLLNGDSAADYLLGQEGNDTLNGGDSNNTLVGGAGADSLLGGQNDDLCFGGDDADTLAGGLGNDAMAGDAGNDSLLGEEGNDYLLGQENDDIILGGIGNDRNLGDAGNDTLAGGSDSDFLAGGSGIDEFLFGAASDPFYTLGIDTVDDFTAGEKLVLSKATFTSLTSGIGDGFSGAGEFALVSGNADTSTAIIVYDSTTGGLFYNTDGSAAGFGNGGQFAVINGSPGLTALDFKMTS